MAESKEASKAASKKESKASTKEARKTESRIASKDQKRQCYLPTLPLPSTPLLNLPVEIFLLVWEQLPPYNRACLVLTCRGFYASYFASILDDLDQEDPISRSQRLYLLRLLRTDLKQHQFLCHSCLKFHRDPYPTINLKGLPPRDYQDYYGLNYGRLELPGGGGFPFCDSVYAFALREVHDHLQTPSDRGLRTYTGQYYSDLNLQYQIKVDVGRQGLYMATCYTYHNPYHASAKRRTGDDKPEAPELAKVARQTNIEFCNHLRLGDDFIRGDGSMGDQVEAEFARVDSRSSPPEFWCDECHVNIKITSFSLNNVTMWVWQSFETNTLEPWRRPARLDRVELPPYDGRTHPPQKPKSWFRRGLDRVGLH